jgi:hypothetical protein
MRAPATEAEAYRLLERLRWGGAPRTCPHCGATGPCYFLSPRTGEVRRTRTGGSSARRVWKCGRCRRQFSVLTGTVLEGTRVPLRIWIGAVASWRGESAPPARADELGLSGEAARHLGRRLELALERAAPPASADTERRLAALLSIPAADAAEIRGRTRGRARPRRQYGPTAQYGG